MSKRTESKIANYAEWPFSESYVLYNLINVVLSTHTHCFQCQRVEGAPKNESDATVFASVHKCLSFRVQQLCCEINKVQLLEHSAHTACHVMRSNQLQQVDMRSFLNIS